jgi:sec-independent protein translocase protein TatA
MLGLDNPIHLAFLLVLLLLVFGAKRLPEMGRSLGAGMRGFKDSLTGAASQPTPTLREAPASGPAAALAAAPSQAAQVPPASEPQAPSAA